MSEKKVIKGEDIIVVVDGKPTLHATSHNLKVDLDLKSIRTKNTDGEEKYPGDVAWSTDGDGLVVIDPELAETNSSEDVLQLLLSKKLVEVVVKSPINGLKKTYSGKGYITSFSLGTPAGDNATYNYSITGSGTLAPKDPIIPPTQ